MKPLYFFCLIGLTTLFSCQSVSDSKEQEKPLTGSSPFVPFQGLQADLITGVSSEKATEKPLVRHAYMASPDVIGLIVDAQAAIRYPIKPYKEEPGDSVDLTGYRIPIRLAAAAGVEKWLTEAHKEKGIGQLHRLVYRNEAPLGWLVGKQADLINPMDELVGEKLVDSWIEEKANYQLSVGNNPSEMTPIDVQQVYHKNKPHDYAKPVKGKRVHPIRHTIYLKLANPIEVGSHVQLGFATGGPEQLVKFQFADKQLRSEAIHVNQQGYHTNQQQKYAFLSSWLGDGGALAYEEDMQFQLLNEKTGETAFEGNLELLSVADRTEYLVRETTPIHTTKTNVYKLDFSKFSQEGIFRAYLPGIGCSFPFAINKTIWEETLTLQMKGLFHQRSGLDMGPPYTSYKIKRNLHPDDGIKFHLTDPKKFYADKDFPRTPNPFERIKESVQLDTHHPGAWGGWNDAADFDRSVLPQRHTAAVHAIMELFDHDKAYFESIKLNIPEADNAIPDLIDEALWCMDFYLRIQQEDGGMPSAVESIEHPRAGETPWLESLPIALTPPSPQTCYVYAAAAAHAADILKYYDTEKADQFKRSAERAYAWAANNSEVSNIYERPHSNVQVDHNNAVFYLMRLTGEAKWHSLFKKTLLRDESGALMLPDYRVPFARTLGSYALLEASYVDQALQEECKAFVLSLADDWVAQANKNAYNALGPIEDGGLTKSLQPSWYGGAEIIAAHKLTNDSKYLDALVRSTQFCMGANPMNMSLISGMGSRFLKPYIKATLHDNADIPHGIPVYGVKQYHKFERLKHLDRYHYPKGFEWPFSESFIFTAIPFLNEFTIKIMSFHIRHWGYLAQQYQP